MLVCAVNKQSQNKATNKYKICNQNRSDIHRNTSQICQNKLSYQALQ